MLLLMGKNLFPDGDFVSEKPVAGDVALRHVNMAHRHDVNRRSGRCAKVAVAAMCAVQ